MLPNSSRVGFEFDFAHATEVAAASHQLLVIYCFSGDHLDGAAFAKEFNQLSKVAVILVDGTNFHGNSPTPQQMSVK